MSSAETSESAGGGSEHVLQPLLLNKVLLTGRNLEGRWAPSLRNKLLSSFVLLVDV